MGLEHDFPVREASLPRIRVPAARLDEWKEVAQDEIMRALSHRHSWYNGFKERVREGFEMIADRANLKAFVRPVPGTPDKDILIRSTLEGLSLDELVAGFYCDSTYDVRCMYAHLYEGNFLDAGILQAHEARTDEDPMHFVGVRWIAFRSPAPSIVTSREFLFFSYEGTAYDVDGNRVLFRFLRSMPMDGIDVDKTGLPPLVTGKISNLHFYRQNGSRVDAFTKAMHSNAGNMPAWLVTKTISFMFPGIVNVETVCDARALLANGTAKLNPGRVRHASSSSSSRSSGNSVTSHVAALASANACSVCFHKFKLTRAKRRCQGCIREVCKRCTKRMFFFDELKSISDTGVVPLRFCLNCTRQARADIREVTAVLMAHQRASLSTRRSSSGSLGSAGRHAAKQQLVRRIPSGQCPYHPEMEPYVDSYSSNSFDHDESDDESEGCGGYNANALLAPSAPAYHRRTPSPLQPHQLEQLQMLQQQRQYDPRDHEEFVRLYGQYAARQDKLGGNDQVGRRQYGPAPPGTPPPPSHPLHHPPKPFRRQNSGGVGWNHQLSSPSPRTASGFPLRPSPQSPMYMIPDVPRHMIPPMPQPDVPSSRPLPAPLNPGSRQGSAQNLLINEGATRTVASLSGPKSPQEDALASEDLETIFRLRSMLFNGEADTETMSTTSTTSSLQTAAQRKALAAGDSHLRPQLVEHF